MASRGVRRLISVSKAESSLSPLPWCAQDRIQDCFLPPPPLRAATINNSDLSSLSQTACHWSLQLSTTRLTLQTQWPKRFRRQRLQQKQRPFGRAKRYSPLSQGERLMNKPLSAGLLWSSLPLTELWDFQCFPQKPHFILWDFVLRETPQCVVPACVHISESRTDQTSSDYLICFSLVDVLHSIMRRLCSELSEWIIHPHGRLGWTRIRPSDGGKLWEEWGEERMEKGKRGEPKGGKEMKGGGKESRWKERRGNEKE